MNVTLTDISVRYISGEEFDYIDADISDLSKNADAVIDDALAGHLYDDVIEFDYDVDGNRVAIDFDTGDKALFIGSDDLGFHFEGRMYPNTNKPLSEVIKDHTGYIEKVISGEWKNEN